MHNGKKILQKILSIAVIVISVAVIVGLVILCIYNWCVNKSFFEMSISNIITFLIAIVFSYYYSQRNSDKRKRKEIVEKNINKLQNLINDSILYNLNEEVRNNDSQLRMNIRKISNHISNLKEFEKEFCFEDKMKEIQEKFDTYKEEVDTIFENKDYKDGDLNKLKKNLSLIDDKLELIIICLYK